MLDEQQAQKTVVEVAKVRPREADHVDRYAAMKVVDEARDEDVDVLIHLVAGVHHVDAQNSYGLLLQPVVGVVHTGVHDKVIRLAVGRELKAQAEPALAVIRPLKVDG